MKNPDDFSFHNRCVRFSTTNWVRGVSPLSHGIKPIRLPRVSTLRPGKARSARISLPPSHQPPVKPAVQKQLPLAQPVAAEHVKPTEYYGAAFLQGNGKTLYLLFNHSLYKSIKPTADSWDRLSENIQSATADPQSPGVIYAVRNSNSVIKTLDDGANWLQVSNGLPCSAIHWVIVNPPNPQEVFAGTESGLYPETSVLPVLYVRNVPGIRLWNDGGEEG